MQSVSAGLRGRAIGLSTNFEGIEWKIIFFGCGFGNLLPFVFAFWY
jgi:hypothetical protein